jgi:hypothetical protein
MTVFPIIFNEIMHSDFRTFQDSIHKSCIFYAVAGLKVLSIYDVELSHSLLYLKSLCRKILKIRRVHEVLNYWTAFLTGIDCQINHNANIKSNLKIVISLWIYRHTVNACTFESAYYACQCNYFSQHYLISTPAYYSIIICCISSAI